MLYILLGELLHYVCGGTTDDVTWCCFITFGLCLSAMPDEGEGNECEDMEGLLRTVQSSIEQLGKLQQTAAVS